MKPLIHEAEQHRGIPMPRVGSVGFGEEGKVEVRSTRAATCKVKEKGERGIFPSEKAYLWGKESDIYPGASTNQERAGGKSHRLK